jgi:hypothetical protein
LDPRIGKKGLGRCEDFGSPACLTNQQFQRFAYRYIVVNDENCRLKIPLGGGEELQIAMAFHERYTLASKSLARKLEEM